MFAFHVKMSALFAIKLFYSETVIHLIQLKWRPLKSAVYKRKTDQHYYFWVFDRLMPDWPRQKYVKLKTKIYNLAVENQVAPVILCKFYKIPQ